MGIRGNQGSRPLDDPDDLLRAWHQRFHPAAPLSTYRFWCHFFACLFQILMFDSQAVTGYLSGPWQKGHEVTGPS